MSKENEAGQEKSEAPTGKKLGEARKNGQVAKSQDLSSIIGMTAAFSGIYFLSPYLWKDLKDMITLSFSISHLMLEDGTSVTQLQQGFVGLLLQLGPKIFLLFFIAGVFGGGCTAIQTNFLWSKKLLWPKLRNINPVTGLKRLFSTKNLFNTAKSLAKLAIIAPIAYFAFLEIFPELMALMGVPLQQQLPYTGKAAALIFMRVAVLLFILAIIDYIWHRYQHNRDMKMSKQEVKDEKKAVEGDEKTRRLIIQKGLQRAYQRMFQDIPSADVIVTNPTHIAVALSYSMGKGSAPKVVAKGKGYVAERIKKIARENNIPIIERKPLARALFKAVEIGQEIPYELYSAVAELLSYVYRIGGQNPFAKKMRAGSESNAR